MRAPAVAVVAALARMAQAPLFDAETVSLLRLGMDPSDEAEGRIADRLPGRRLPGPRRGRPAAPGGLANEEKSDLPARVVVDPSPTIRRMAPIGADGARAEAVLAWPGARGRLVGGHPADEAGPFKRLRDDTTHGPAHRHVDQPAASPWRARS